MLCERPVAAPLARTSAALRGLLEVVRVDLDELVPLVGDLVLREAGVDRARLDAGVAVDALLRIDVEHLDRVVVGLVRRRVDAVDRADLDAGVVLGADAGLGDDVRHEGGSSCGSNGGWTRHSAKGRRWVVAGRDVQLLTRPRGGSHALRTSGAETARKTAPWPVAEGDERYGDATHHREDPGDPAPPALARTPCARAHRVAGGRPGRHRRLR